MSKILIQFAHPALRHSRVHKKLLSGCRGLPGVTINDLYELYPDLFIDVKREQELLLQHDIIIFQHPFYWYSSPPIIKQWLDLVLEYNWAYGPKGFALAGKKVISVLSCGGDENAYKNTGYNRFTLHEYLRPFSQSIELCRMEYLPPLVVFGTHHITNENIGTMSNYYVELLNAFVKGKVPSNAYKELLYLNLLDLQIKDNTQKLL